MIGAPDDPRPVVAFDWSTKGLHVTFDGEHIERCASILALLDDARLETPHRLAAEATFESWDPINRYRIVGQLRDAGHELFVYRPLHTARARKAGNIKKSDADDVLVIWRYANHPDFHLYAPCAPRPEWVDVHAALNGEYAMIRLTHGKPALAERAAEILGPFSGRSEDSRLVLGSKDYSESLLAALMFVASKGLTRAEMERMIGLHGSGYPSILRSDVHVHSFRHARKRLVKARDDVHDRRAVDEFLSGDNETIADPARTVKDWTVYRRELRCVYHELVTGLAASHDADPQDAAPSAA